MNILSFKKQDDFFAYGPVVSNNGDACLYIDANFPYECERLICQKGDKKTVIFESLFIFSYAFLNDKILFSAFKDESNTELFVSDLEGNIIALFRKSGKVTNIRTNGNFAVYERRIGKSSKVFMFDINNIESDIQISNNNQNAYDPDIAVDENGKVAITYTVFIDGNYRIALKELNEEQIIISDKPFPCITPSISAKSGGGFYICFVSYTEGRSCEDTYLRHFKNRERHALFTNYTKIYVFVYQDGKLLQFSNDRNHTIKGTDYGRYPRISEIGDKSPCLIFQKYDCFQGETASRKPKIVLLHIDDSFSKETVLSEYEIYEGYPSSVVLGNDIFVCYTKDNRKTGWNVNGEWFDMENQIELGLKKVSIDCIATTQTLQSHCLNPHPTISLEEKAVRKKRDDGKILAWGQTHCHTNISICQRPYDQCPDFNIRLMQDVLKCDFGTITDHEYNQWDIDIHMNHKITNFYYFKGKFVSFPAYEWTGSKAMHEGGPFGHVNPLYLEEQGRMDFYNPTDPTCNGSTLNKLWNAYENKKIITIPHHTSDDMHTYNFDFFNEKFIPVVELFQDCRGQHEQRDVIGSTDYKKSDKGWVIDALKRGLKFGFIGGGDHSGIAIGGVLADELSRNAIYEAMMKRQTFASTSISADVTFTANGKPVGSVLKTDSAKFNLEVSARAKISYIEIVENGHTVSRNSVSRKSFSYQWSANTNGELNFHYVRICFENGEVIWTSPIWLEKK